jgi:methenyltetrahydromethanopterin cyclohydrolase
MNKTSIIRCINTARSNSIREIEGNAVKFKRIAPVLAEVTSALERAKVHPVEDDKWSGSTYDLSLYIGGTSPSVSVYLKGDDTLKRVIAAVLPVTASFLRATYGSDVKRRENSISDTRVGLWWTVDEGWFSFHLNFYLSDSRVCGRVQVGTKMVETPVYEVRCEDGSPPPSVIDEDTERLLAV